MPYGTPQSMMYNMRGRGTDGMMIRNRSREQQFSGSGNPAMPIFNTGRGDYNRDPTAIAPPDQNTNGAMYNNGTPAGANGLGGWAMPQFNSPIQGGYPNDQQMQEYINAQNTANNELPTGNSGMPMPQPPYSPSQVTAQNTIMNRFRTGGYASNPGSMASMMPNINYNTAPGTSPFAAAIAANRKPPVTSSAPMPNINPPVQSTY